MPSEAHTAYGIIGVKFGFVNNSWKLYAGKKILNITVTVVVCLVEVVM